MNEMAEIMERETERTKVEGWRLHGLIEAGRPLDDPLQLVELAALDLAEPRLDAAQSLGLLALDLLLEAALARPEALADLVEGTAALGRVRLELRARLLDRLLRELLEVGLQL